MQHKTSHSLHWLRLFLLFFFIFLLDALLKPQYLAHTCMICAQILGPLKTFKLV